MFWLGRLAFLLLMAAAPGCYTLSLMQDPKPVAPGTVRATVGMASNIDGPAPSQHLGVRVGLVPQAEARVKLSFASSDLVQSAQVGVNLEALLAEDKSVLFMPYYRYDPDILEDKDSLWDSEYPHHEIHVFAVPVLFVQHFGADQFFLGPDMHLGSRDGLQFAAVGGHVGYAIAAGAHVHFTPELSVLTPIAGTPRPNPSWTPGAQTTLLPGDVIVELGLSCSFGAAN